MVYCNDLCRCSIFGTKSVTSCEYRDGIKLRTFQSCNYIQVKRFAHCTRLFCSVKNSDLLYAVRNSSNQCFCTERSVKTYLYNTYFFACCHEVIDGFFNGIAYRTHSYDNLFRISCAIVVEELVVGTDLSIYFIHVFLYDSRHCIVEGVTCFTCLEEDIRVLSGTSLAGMVRVQGVCSECLNCIHIYHIFQIFVVPCFDLLDLVRSTESIEEVDEGDTAFDCCTMCNRCKVHYFLYGRFAQHSGTRLTTCINVRVITEDRQCMAGNCTGRYVEYARKLLTCDLIQIRYHQKQTLRSSIGSGKSTC